MAGCAFILGIHDPVYVSETELKKTAPDFDIENQVLATIDTAEYRNHIRKIEGTSKIVAHDFMQPMMVKIFVNDTLNAYLVNCYVQGFPGLNWMATSFFDSLPPVNKLHLVYHEFLHDEMRCLELLERKPLDHKKYVILVYWSCFTKKQSRSLIKSAYHFLKYDPGNETEIIFVNADNLFVP